MKGGWTLKRLGGVAVVLALLGFIGAWRVWGKAGISVDGPVVSYDAPWVSFGASGLDALIGGELELTGACVYLSGSPVRWPDGTSWNEEEAAVELADGTLVREGDSVSGGGGSFGGPEDADFFEDSATARALADCREPGDEVSIFNGTEDLELRRAD